MDGMRGQIIILSPTEEKKGTLTIEKLWALYVTLLHLLTFVCCRLHITDSGGKDGSTRLHQYLTQVHAVTGGGTMQGRPTQRHTSVGVNSNPVSLNRLINLFHTNRPSKVSSPAITVSCIYINTKVQQELDDVMVSGTHCVMEGCDALIIGGAGIVNL